LSRYLDQETAKGPFDGGGGATRPLPRDGGVEETQQSGHAPRSGPEVKMEEVVPKMARRRGSDAEQLRRR